MFDSRRASLPGNGPLDAATITAWVGQLGDLDRDVDDAARIDQLRAMEEAKNALAAAQARVAVDLDASQRQQHAEAGLPPARQGRGVAAQVALARRESPHRGQQHLSLAHVLLTEMPHTYAALATGVITEWRATLLARETACLTREDRQTVDRAIAGDPQTLDELGDRGLVAAIKRLAYRLDPHSVVERGRRATADRRVTSRPAPDTMGYLTALLPVAQCVAVFAALARQADALVAAGDPRSRGQVMADTLVERVTGQATASGVPVEVHLVMSLATVLGGGSEPAHLDGHGPVPAGLARDLVAEAAHADRAWLRRLFTRPGTGTVVGLDSRHRIFPAGLARLIALRDQTCRTPWCDAPIRHTDHSVSHHAGGDTSLVNGQGLCQACNHAKQAPGWRAQPLPGPRHTIRTSTPSGHTYDSTAPPLPGDPPVEERVASGWRAVSALEISFAELVLAS